MVLNISDGKAAAAKASAAGAAGGYSGHNPMDELTQSLILNEIVYNVMFFASHS